MCWGRLENDGYLAFPTNNQKYSSSYILYDTTIINNDDKNARENLGDVKSLSFLLVKTHGKTKNPNRKNSCNFLF